MLLLVGGSKVSLGKPTSGKQYHVTIERSASSVPLCPTLTGLFTLSVTENDGTLWLQKGNPISCCCFSFRWKREGRVIACNHISSSGLLFFFFSLPQSLSCSWASDDCDTCVRPASHHVVSFKPAPSTSCSCSSFTALNPADFYPEYVTGIPSSFKFSKCARNVTRTATLILIPPFWGSSQRSTTN